MATDFVQSLILLSITILVAVLCYVKIGGLGEFFSHFSDPAVAEDFKFVKEPGAFPDNKFSMHWIGVIFFMTIYHQISLTSVDRFLVVKDGNEASKAAYLGAGLMAMGALIWFFPPFGGSFPLPRRNHGPVHQQSSQHELCIHRQQGASERADGDHDRRHVRRDDEFYGLLPQSPGWDLSS